MTEHILKEVQRAGVLRRASIGLVLLAASACGKKGAPTPPIPERPAPVASLEARQEGNLAVLVWSFPDKTTSGRSIGAIEKVEIWRSEGEPADRPAPPASSSASSSPVPASPAASAPTAPFGSNVENGGFRSTPKVDSAMADFLASRLLVQSLSAAELRKGTRGPSLVWSEIIPEELRTSGLPRKRWTYGVVVRADGRDSESSSLATLDPRPIQPAPNIAEVRSGENRIRLVLIPRDPDPVSRHLDSPRGSVVFRRSPGEAEPLEPAAPPVVDPEIAFEETLGVGCYVYRAAAEIGGQRYRGPRGDEIVVEVVDLFPPPIPRATELFREERRVSVFWEPVSAADLAGYFIERSSNRDSSDGLWTRLNPVPVEPGVTKWSDAAVSPADRIYYRVRSVDRSGNVSQPSAPIEATPF